MQPSEKAFVSTGDDVSYTRIDGWCVVTEVESEELPWAEGEIVRNLGKPILLSGLMLDGVTEKAAKAGESVSILTRFSMTSDDRMFHLVMPQISAHLAHLARQAGTQANLQKAETALLVIRPDNTGELWLDSAALAIDALPRRSMPAGTVVFDHDVFDVLAVSFPLVEIRPDDRVVCVLRVGWKFGFFADFNPARVLDTEAMKRDLGTVYRRLEYAELYHALDDGASMDELAGRGWFPFAELLRGDFNGLVQHVQNGWDLADAEEALIAKFDEARLDRMFQFWMTREHFLGKETLLRPAIRAFLAKDPVSVIKNVLTEIEGILNAAYRTANGRGAKTGALLRFAVESAEQRAGSSSTLLFTGPFGKYLTDFVFANFDPQAGPATSGSRHAVGHGAASPESYTMARALQALLTLDQLALYT